MGLYQSLTTVSTIGILEVVLRGISAEEALRSKSGLYTSVVTTDLELLKYLSIEINSNKPHLSSVSELLFQLVRLRLALGVKLLGLLFQEENLALALMINDSDESRCSAASSGFGRSPNTPRVRYP